MSFWSQQAIVKSAESSAKVLQEGCLDSGSWTFSSDYQLSDLSQVTYSEIADFLRQHNNVGNTTITLISEPLFNLFQDHLSVVVYDSSGIAATCMALILPSSLGVDIAHTTYLCVRKDLSKKGLAAKVIRQMMKLTSERGIYVGYHQVDRPIGQNSVPIRSWWYPVNHKLVSQLGFRLPVKGSHQKIRDHFQLRRNSQIVLNSWNEHKDWIVNESKRFQVTTDLLHMLRSIPQIQTVIGVVSGQPIGCISYRRWEIYFNCLRKVVPVTLIILAIRPTEELFSALLPSFEGLVYFHQIGDLTKEYFQQIKAVEGNIRYLNWYNWSGQYTPDQIMLPFL